MKSACARSMETQIRIKNIKKEQKTREMLRLNHDNVALIPREKILPTAVTFVALETLDLLGYKDRANVWKALEGQIVAPDHVEMEMTERKIFECFDMPGATTMNGYDQKNYFPRSYDNLNRNINKKFVYSLKNNPLAPMYGFYENNSYACATRLLLLPENCNEGEILSGKYSLEIREKLVAEGRWTVLETQDGKLIVRLDCKFSHYRSLHLSWNVEKEGFDLVTFLSNGNPDYLIRKSDVVIDIPYSNPSFSDIFGRKKENEELFDQKCTRSHYYQIVFNNGKYEYVSTDDSWRFCRRKLEECDENIETRNKSMMKARSLPMMNNHIRMKTKKTKHSAHLIALDIHEQAKGNRQRKMIKDNLKNKKNYKRSSSFKTGGNKSLVGWKKGAGRKVKSKKQTRKKNRWN